MFAKGYTPNWTAEVFVIKKVKNTVPWTYVISDINRDFNCWNILRKRIAKEKWNWKRKLENEFKVEKVLKRNLYVKCKGYDNFLIFDIV